MREYGKDNQSSDVPPWGGEKSSKTEADYREGDEQEHCGRCSMFRPPHSCTAVDGMICWDDVCDYFKQK